MKNKGFTLIELSIVLVIIGLLAGGVIVGRELIHVAEVRSQLKQFESYNAALKVFKLKYDAVPGDILPNMATQFGLSYSWYMADPAGNGDGIIQAYGSHRVNVPILILWGEPSYFFPHLSEAGLISEKFNLPLVIANAAYGYGSDYQFPKAKLGGGIIPFSTTEGKLAYYYGMNLSFPSGNMVTVSSVSTDGVITAADAYAIDSKIDDGKPMTGGVGPFTHTRTEDTRDNRCIISVAADAYNVSNIVKDCRIVIEVQ